LTLLDDRNIRPMLAETSDPFDSADHYFEPKWDGMRCIAYFLDHKLELQNRNLVNVTKSYPELEGIPRNITSKAAIVDGEIVVLEKGLPSFDALQNRFGVTDPVQIRSLSRRVPVTYIAFDLLHLNGKDLVDLPLSNRREKLERIVKEGPHLLLSRYVREQGKSYFNKALELGFEGAMAKKSDSHYQVGIRSEDWLKLKQVKTLDCIIAGYTFGTGGRSTTFGALVLAAYDTKGRLTHLGNVGTGFTDENLKRLMRILKPLQTKTKTVPGEVKAPAPICWVKPKLVAEVGFMKMTRERKLRFPRFVRLRLDGNPSDCRLETSVRGRSR
jgi:bifunctional non-homologous end joining protein LigD